MEFWHYWMTRYDQHFDNKDYYVTSPSVYDKIKNRHFDEVEALLPRNVIMKDIIMLPICNVGHQWELCIIFNPKLYCTEGTLIYETDCNSIATNPTPLRNAAFNDDCSNATNTNETSKDDELHSEAEHVNVHSAVSPHERDDVEVIGTDVIITDDTQDITEQQYTEDTEVTNTDMVKNDASNETGFTSLNDKEEQSSECNRLVETNDSMTISDNEKGDDYGIGSHTLLQRMNNEQAISGPFKEKKDDFSIKANITSFGKKQLVVRSDSSSSSNDEELSTNHDESMKKNNVNSTKDNQKRHLTVQHNKCSSKNSDESSLSSNHAKSLKNKSTAQSSSSSSSSSDDSSVLSNDAESTKESNEESTNESDEKSTKDGNKESSNDDESKEDNDEDHNKLPRNSRRNNDTESVNNNVTSLKFEILLLHAKLVKKKFATPHHTKTTKNIMKFVHYLWLKQKNKMDHQRGAIMNLTYPCLTFHCLKVCSLCVVNYYAITVFSH
jgi:hypothetical protein